MITEALLGAKLVLFKLVGDNDTPFRAFAMGLHLVNSAMLMASLTLVAEFSRNVLFQRREGSPWNIQGAQTLKVRQIVIGTVLAFLILGVTGTIASLSSTLFPSNSLLEGLAQDWDPNSHFLIRLRGIHPLMGLLLGGSIALTAWLSIQIQKANESELLQRSQWLAKTAAFGVCFGIATLVSLAPVYMKLSHLALGHTIWILIVLWLRSLLYTIEPRV